MVAVISLEVETRSRAALGPSGPFGGERGETFKASLRPFLNLSSGGHAKPGVVHKLKIIGVMREDVPNPTLSR